MLNRNSSFVKAGLVAGAMVAGTAAHAYQQEDPAAAETTAETPEPAPEAEASTNVVEAVMASADHAMLVRALQQAELVDTLAGPGPYTVFAPTDEAFGLVPQETLDALMQDAAKPHLQTLLSYHVVPGSYDAETLVSRIEGAGGTLTLQTAAGQPLTVRLINEAIVIADASGGQAYVTTEDLEQSNGMIHVVNSIVIPSFEAPASEPADTAAGGAAAGGAIAE